MLQRHGLSLLEVLIGLICLSAIGLATMRLIKIRSAASRSQDSSIVLQLAMIETIADVRGKKTAELPALGECETRYYSKDGNLLTTSRKPLADPECTTLDAGAPDPSRIKIIAKFRSPSAVSVSYNPSAFLKLPAYSSLIAEVEFLGSILHGTSAYHHLSMISYRKL